MRNPMNYVEREVRFLLYRGQKELLLGLIESLSPLFNVPNNGSGGLRIGEGRGGNPPARHPIPSNEGS